MKKKLVGFLAALVALVGAIGLVACGEKEEDTPADLGAEKSAYMVVEIPDWATSASLAQKDVTFIIYENGYENKLESAEGVKGTYTYSAMTDVYTLSKGGTLTVTSEGAIYKNGNTEIALTERVTKSAVGTLTGSTHILASGLYDMEVGFTLTLFDDNTFELSNLMSPTKIPGTWAYDETTKYTLTAEGITVKSCTGNRRMPTITIESSIAGSDGNVYEFEVALKGAVQ